MMIMRMWRLGVLLPWLAACSSVVPVSYYQLEQPLPAKSQASEAASDLFIEPVQVAAYLNSNALILQTSAVQLHKSTQHQWAEALDLQLQRTLLNTLSAELPDWRVQTLAASAASCRLLLQLDRFHGGQEGMVELSGRYHLLCGERTHSSHFSASAAQSAPGYPAMVSTLSALWLQQIRLIAAELRAQVTQE